VRRVLLLRHGKAKRGSEYEVDFDRPLAGRGKRDARRMGELLAGRDLVPDLVISSPARRARRTAERCAEAAGYEGEIWFVEALYSTGVDAYIGLLSDLDASVGTVLFIGHNPDIAEMVEALSRSWSRMPTSALACVEFDVESWDEVTPGAGKLAWVETPRDL